MLGPLLIALGLAAAAPPDPEQTCRDGGELIALNELDAAKKKLSHRALAKVPCALYHRAQIILKESEKTPDRSANLRALKLFKQAGSEAPPSPALSHQVLQQMAAVHQLELALRLRRADLAPSLDLIPDDVPSPERRFLLATALLALGDKPAALAAHHARPLGKGRYRLEQLSAVLLLTDDEMERSALITEVRQDYPDSWLAAQLGGDAAGKTARGKAPLETPEEALRELHSLHSRHSSAQVLRKTPSLLSKPLPVALKCLVLFYRGAALRKLRAYAKAESALLEAKRVCEQVDEPQGGVTLAGSVPTPNEALKRAWFLLGQVQAIAKPFAVAAETLLAFSAKFQGDPLADDALWHASQSARKARLDDDALSLAERIVKEHPDGDMCTEAAFRTGYAMYKRGDFAGASERFAAAANNPCVKLSAQRARMRYWQGRACERANGCEPIAAYQHAVTEAPMSYEAVLARTALGKLGAEPASLPTSTAPGQPPAAGPPPQSVLALEGIRPRVLAYASLGLFADAQLELQARRPAPTDVLALPLYAALCHIAFDFARSHWPYRHTLTADLLGAAPTLEQAASLPEATDAAPLPGAWQVAYPMPYRALVFATERSERLPPAFLISLVREESAFALDAASWANAYGLTQLLVTTAERSAADLGFDKPVTAELLRESPAASLKLGAHYLAMLQKRYMGIMPLVLGAYNAGEPAADFWLKHRGRDPLDEFVEDIPIDETRGYVKRIMGTWTVYRHQLGLGDPQLDGSSPALSQRERPAARSTARSEARAAR